MLEILLVYFFEIPRLTLFWQLFCDAMNAGFVEVTILIALRY